MNNYKDTFTVIELYDGMIIPTLLASIEKNTIQYAEKDCLKKKWIKTGLPLLYKSLETYLKSNKKIVEFD